MSKTDELFLLEAINTDQGGTADGPIAFTCNCHGSCQGGLCSGTCCTVTPSGFTVLEI